MGTDMLYTKPLDSRQMKRYLDCLYAAIHDGMSYNRAMARCLEASDAGEVKSSVQADEGGGKQPGSA